MTRPTWTVLCLGAICAACVEGRVYAAPVAAGDGVWLELSSARVFEDRIEIQVLAHNARGQPFDVDRSAWRLETPDAVILRPDEQSPARIWSSGYLGVVFRHDRPQLTDAPGFWLLPAGLRDERGPIALPAMPLGHPITPRPAALP